MKEIKVYMSKLPCQCIDCQFAYDGRYQLNGEIYCIENCRRGDCPLIDIKTHDREVVKEVCETIARNVRVRKIQEEWYVIETDLRAILNKIQKKYEK